MKKILFCLLIISAGFVDAKMPNFQCFEEVNKEFADLFTQIMQRIAFDVQDVDFIQLKVLAHQFEFQANEVSKIIGPGGSLRRYQELLTNTYDKVAASGIECATEVAQMHKDKLHAIDKAYGVTVQSGDMDEYKLLVKQSMQVNDIVSSTLDMIQDLRMRNCEIK